MTGSVGRAPRRHSSRCRPDPRRRFDVAQHRIGLGKIHRDLYPAHGGFGYAKEFYVERLWREVRLYKIAPVSQQMALNYLAEHVLGLPRSY